MFPLVVVLSALAAAAGTLAQSSSKLAEVQADLDSGHADDAIAHLHDVLAAQPALAPAHNLLCRVYYQEERWGEAIHECERAVQLDSASSLFHLWLARAYGEKADRASFVVAFRMAKEIRTEFETAARLDPSNVGALSDLGEFYTDAPAIVGGGTQKADRIASQLDPLDPEAAHRLRAAISEERKDPGRAENEFQAAIRVSHSPADAWMSLASFYRRQSRWDDMTQALHTGVDLDKDHSSSLVDGATILVRSNRDAATAVRLLRQYLASSHKSEEAPAFRVHVRLGHLLAQQGDAAGAQREYQAALAMARDYKAAAQPSTNTGR